MNKLFGLFLGLAVVNFTLAQDVTLSGTVVNSSTSEPLEFTSVRFKHHVFGTTCDEQGKFRITITEAMSQDTIQFSRIGFSLKEVPVKEYEHNKMPVIKLELNTIVLSEVVIGSNNNDWAAGIMDAVIDKIETNYIGFPILFQTKIRSTLKRQDRQISSYIIGNLYYNSGYQKDNAGNSQFAITGSCFQEYDGVQRKWVAMGEPQKKLNQDLVGLTLRDFVFSRTSNFLNSKNLKNYSFDLEAETVRSITLRFSSLDQRAGVVPYMYLINFSGSITIDKQSMAVTEVRAKGIMDPKTFQVRNESTVREFEINSVYKKNESGKYYWFNGTYKENYVDDSKVEIENQLVSTTKQNIKSDLTYKNQNLCE